MREWAAKGPVSDERGYSHPDEAGEADADLTEDGEKEELKELRNMLPMRNPMIHLGHDWNESPQIEVDIRRVPICGEALEESSHDQKRSSRRTFGDRSSEELEEELQNLVNKVEAEIKPVPEEYKSVVRDIKLSGIVSKFQGYRSIVTLAPTLSR